ncbi:tripartite motif-containing protein 16-like [Genypterus blacodes]|uniref:tripartite motif-containing protein 16-like n=1 Tax=Genypterus blacodes TaxID=154954 RepID=UPI003F76A797
MATLNCTEENPEEQQNITQASEEQTDPTATTTTSDLCQSSDALLPQDVLCDSCIDGPSKALKSCLTCLVSYCKDHLRPHLENVKFQNHRLVEPLRDIECQVCEVHHLPLERFCLTDGCCVCLECESLQHNGHMTAMMGEARKQIEAELQRLQVESTQRVSAAETAIGKLQNNKDSVQSSVAEVCVVIEEQFARLRAAVEETRKRAVEVLEGEQSKVFKQAEGIRAHLEQRKEELRKTLTVMNKLSRNKNDVNFLQEYSEWKKGVSDVCPPTVCNILMDHLPSYGDVVTDVTQELSDLILLTYTDKLSLICKSGKAQMPESPPSSLPQPLTREEFLKYTRSLTFDPDTTHNFLRLTEDNRKLTNTSPWQHTYPDHPARFEHWRQAMTSDSLYLGRHYLEAELSGEGSHIGVTYKSIDRKGEPSSCCISGNYFSWCLGRNSRGVSAWHGGVETPLDVSDITKIGLYIDFQRGCVSFFDVVDSMKPLHRYNADFMEPLYATAWLSKKDNVVSLLNATLDSTTGDVSV